MRFDNFKPVDDKTTVAMCRAYVGVSHGVALEAAPPAGTVRATFRRRCAKCQQEFSMTFVAASAEAARGMAVATPFCDACK